MKMVSRKIKRMLLPLLGMMWFSSAYSAMTVRIGDRVETSQGNSITITTEVPNEKVSICIDGLSFEYSGPNYWRVDDSQAQFKTSAWDWIDNGCFAAPEHKVGTFSFFADYDNKVILVKAGGADGYISVDNKVACRRTGVTLHADNLVAGDNLRWAKVNAPGDTLWLTEYDDVVEFSDNLDVVQGTVTFYNRIFREQTRIDTIVDELGDSTFNTVKYDMFVAENSIVIPIKLEGCGYTLTANNASACLSEPITLTCSFEGAGAYKWVNVTTGEEETTSVNTLMVKPHGNETYQVYADGMLVNSIDLTPKSMVDCGFTLTADKELLCLGKETVLSSNFDKASKYEWYVDGVVLETTTIPNLTVKPTETTTYTLYADGFFVGELTVLVEECTFFLTHRYPLNVAVQDSNYLMAAGTAMIEDLDVDTFKWERYDESKSEWVMVVDTIKRYDESKEEWIKVPDTIKSWKLPIFVGSEGVLYRVTYEGLTDSIYVPGIMPNDSIYGGLKVNTLFYETFGYFMSDEVYVNDTKVYDQMVEVGYRTERHGPGHTAIDTTAYPPEGYDENDWYYVNDETVVNPEGRVLVVDTTKNNKFKVHDFIAPDPNGFVVTPTSFSYNGESPNFFVGNDGHLYFSENPMIRHMSGEGWLRNAAHRIQDGYYAITSCPDSMDQNKNNNDYWSINDATANKNGAMLFINAGSQSGAAIYSQPINLNCEYKMFSFGLKVCNAMVGSGNSVALTIAIASEPIQHLDDLTSANELWRSDLPEVPSADSSWTVFDEFISLDKGIGGGVPFYVIVFNKGASGSGNDILIDDIVFSACVPETNMNVYRGDSLLGADVVSCETEDLTLKAQRKTPASTGVYYVFQYQEYDPISGDTLWVNFDKDDKDPVKPFDSSKSEVNDNIYTWNSEYVISTSDLRFRGTVMYRFVTADNKKDVVDYITKGTTDNPCGMENNVVTSIITIRNTNGGVVDESFHYASCDSINSVIEVVAERDGFYDSTYPEDPRNVTWLSAWIDAEGDTLFKPVYNAGLGHFEPVLRDTIDKILIRVAGESDNDLIVSQGYQLTDIDSLVIVTYPSDTLSQPEVRTRADVRNLTFRYFYEGGNYSSLEDDCGNDVKVTTEWIRRLDLKSMTNGNPVESCNDVAIKIGRSIEYADFDFKWFDSKGNEITDGGVYSFTYSEPSALDSTITLKISEDSLRKIARFEGYVIAKPKFDGSVQYCASETHEVRVDFIIRNGYFKLKVVASTAKVCISTEDQEKNNQMSEFIVGIASEKINGVEYPSSEDQEILMSQIKEFKWNLEFKKKDENGYDVVHTEMVTTTEPKYVLMASYTEKYNLLGTTMFATVATSNSLICGDVQNEGVQMTDSTEIRAGGFSLSIEDDKNFCLSDLERIDIKGKLNPISAINNLDSVFWLVDSGLGKDTLLIDSVKNDIHKVEGDTLWLNFSVEKTNFASIFEPGTTHKFYISIPDNYCGADRIVNPALTVKLNEYNLDFDLEGQPDSCLSEGNVYIPTLKIDNEEALNHFKNLTWYVNDTLVAKVVEPRDIDDFVYRHKVTQSENVTFKIVAEDGICATTEREFNKNLSVSYAINLKSENDQTTICSKDDSVEVTILLDPSTSDLHIKWYKWSATFTKGVKAGQTIDLKTVIVNADDRKSAKTLLLKASEFPDLFYPGGAFDLNVVAHDGICDDVESDNKLSFDVNEPFTITLESSDDNSDSYCIGQDGLKEIKLTAIVSPEEAAKHIKAYVWNRLAKPIVSDTTSTNELVLHDEWLSPGVKNKFEVLAFDGICSSADSKVEAGKEISINRYDDARLSLDLSYYTQDKDTVCSIKDLIIIDTTIVRSDDMTGTINYESNFYYSKNPARVTRDYDVLSSNNVFTDNLNLSNYIPGDSLYFKVSIDDGICNAITKEIGTVVLTPFTASISVSKDPICENENVKFELDSLNFNPIQSHRYVKLISWYQSSVESDGNFVPLSDYDFKRIYDPDSLKAGNYKVLSFISDGICYGVQLVGYPVGSVYSYETPQVELKVNAPIKVDLIPSANAYCEGETPNPITFAAKVTQGEPSKYVWYNSENKVVKEILSTSTEDYFSVEPTINDTTFRVEVYDGVCNTIGSAAGDAFSVAVYQPFVLDVASSSYEICLGDSVNLGLGVLQGTARKITWSGDKVIPNKNNNIYSFAYPQLPGEAVYSVTASNGVCEDETVHVGPIIVHEPITVELTSDVSNVTIGAKINLTANVLSGKPLEFEWMDGDVSIGKTNDVKLEEYMPKSTSVFSLYATDGVCPVAFAQLELGVVLPTAFTPHIKDGLNDVYMEGYEVIIFDRYGQKVFEGANGWNGTHKGVMADPGVYFSQVKLLNGKIVSGTIEIVKYD